MMQNKDKFNYWLIGFIDGEGTFHIGINKNKSMKLNYQVIMEFVITQHKRDYDLLCSIKDYLDCGYLIKDGPDKYQYRIRALDQLENKLFPLLDLDPLKTKKNLDAIAFRQVFAKVKNKEHLTEKGLFEIREIKNTMNRKRIPSIPLFFKGATI